MAFLDDYQIDAINKLKNGSILCGGVGSGKSRTGIAYYFMKECGGFIDDDYHIKSVNGRDVNINDCDIILIPGLAYNVYGYRLGRGKGFYDRALKDYQGIKIGVVCDDNIIDEHFEEAHDVKVDYLVSEKRIIKI